MISANLALEMEIKKEFGEGKWVCREKFKKRGLDCGAYAEGNRASRSDMGTLEENRLLYQGC